MRWRGKCKNDNGWFYREGFLFLPKNCNGEWRWLEYAKWRAIVPFPSRHERYWE